MKERRNIYSPGYYNSLYEFGRARGATATAHQTRAGPRWENVQIYNKQPDWSSGPPPCPGLFRGVASPPVLCHKEPARASKAPYHFVFVFCLLPAGSLWHKGSYNRTYERLWMRRAGSLWHKITTEDLDSNVGPRPMRVDQSGRDAEVLSSISTRSIYQAGAIHQLQWQ